MPFCPKCKAEFVAGIRKCSDCDIPLVYALSSEPDQKDDSNTPIHQVKGTEVESALVHLCTVNNEIEAIILRDLLEEAGIESSCQDNSFIHYLYPRLVGQEHNNIGRNDVMVLDKDYKAAKQIAEDYFKSIETREKEEKSEEER
ncbi:MAG: putative signal transducing protein [bacterium]